MKKMFVYMFMLIVFNLNINAQVKRPIIELYSPKTNLSLNLYSIDSFTFSKLFFKNDVIETKLLYQGRYYLANDTLFLVAADNVFKLKKETFEIYIPISIDTLNENQKFLAWVIRFPNGQPKQSGGWNKNNRKEGLWQYYDSSGIEIRKRSFKDGVLVDDNYKWSWEK